MIWFESEIRADTVVPFDLRDRGLTLADGLFETLLSVGGVPHRLADHLRRMAGASAVLRMPFERESIERAVRDLAAAMPEPAAIRVTATRGSGARGLRIPRQVRPTIFAAAAPWSPGMAFQPLRLATSLILRNSTSPLSAVKSLSYLDNILALEAAVEAGADDALLLSAAGGVACTSAGNLFVVKGRDLATPPVSEGVLPGIMRERVLELAPRSGFAVTERPIATAEVLAADAVFATNSLRLLSPVVELDGRPVGRDGVERIAPLRRAILAEIEAECGFDPLAGQTA